MPNPYRKNKKKGTKKKKLKFIDKIASEKPLLHQDFGELEAKTAKMAQERRLMEKKAREFGKMGRFREMYGRRMGIHGHELEYVVYDDIEAYSEGYRADNTTETDPTDPNAAFKKKLRK